MHGAALTHGLFSKRGRMILELKTLYAYSSAVFPLISDARSGIYGSVDIRDYFKKGGHKPIDDALIERIVSIIKLALPLIRSVRHKEYENMTQKVLKTARKGDFVIGPSTMNNDSALLHVMGPLISQNDAECMKTSLKLIRDELEVKGLSDHCELCKLNTNRKYC